MFLNANKLYLIFGCFFTFIDVFASNFPSSMPGNNVNSQDEQKVQKQEENTTSHSLNDIYLGFKSYTVELSDANRNLEERYQKLERKFENLESQFQNLSSQSQYLENRNLELTMECQRLGYVIKKSTEGQVEHAQGLIQDLLIVVLKLQEKVLALEAANSNNRDSASIPSSRGPTPAPYQEFESYRLRPSSSSSNLFEQEVSSIYEEEQSGPVDRAVLSYEQLDKLFDQEAERNFKLKQLKNEHTKKCNWRKKKFED